MKTSIYLKPSGRFYYIAFFVAFVVLSAILYMLPALSPINVYQAIFGLFVLNWVCSGIAFVYFQNFYIHAEDEIITVKEGLVTSKMVVIPFDKISEINTKYTLADRMLGVGTIMIDTMGGNEIEVIFGNVPSESINSFVSAFRHWSSDRNQPRAQDPGGAKPGNEPGAARDSW